MHTGSGPIAKATLGTAAPLLAALLWGLFAAPRARIRIPAVRIAVKVLVYGSATAALGFAGHPLWGGLFLAAVIVNATLIRLASRK